MPTHRVQFGRDVVIVGMANLLRSLRNFLFLLVMTRHLQMSGYGLWEEIGIGVALLLPWTTLQLQGALVRFMAGVEDRASVREGFYSILLTIAGWSAFITLILGLIGPLVGPADSPLMAYAPYALPLLPISAVYNCVLAYFRTFRQMIRHSLLNLGQHFGEIALVALALDQSLGLKGALLALALVRGLAAIIGCALVIKQIGLALPRFSRVTEFLRFSLPTVPDSSFYRIFDAGDRFVLATLISHAAVGMYAAAYTAGSFLSTLVAPLNMVMLPLMSELWNQGRRDELSLYMTQVIFYCSILLLPAIVGIVLYAHPIMDMLVPESYADSRLFFPVLACSFAIFGLGVFGGHLITTAGETIFIMKLLAALTTMNMALNLLLVPLWGIWGAVFSTLLSHSFYTCATLVRARRILAYKMPWRNIAPAAVAAAAMGLGLHLVGRFFAIPLVLAIPAGAVLYLSLLWALRVVTAREVHYAKRLLQRDP